MPVATVADYYAVLTSVQTLVQNLNLQIGGMPPPPVVIRKLPRKRESIDPATMIFVVPEQAEKFRRMAFGPGGSHYYVTDFTKVVIVVPNNQDQQANLGTYLSWRQQIAAAQVPLLTAPANILRQEVTYDPPLERKLIAEQYDYSALGLAVTLFY